MEATEERDGLGWWARMDLRNLLSAIFTKAKDWNLLDGPNPCEHISVGKKKIKRAKRIPGPEDLTKFLESLPDTAIIGADGARLIVIVAVVAGLRVSEVLGLQHVTSTHVPKRYVWSGVSIAAISMSQRANPRGVSARSEPLPTSCLGTPPAARRRISSSSGRMGACLMTGICNSRYSGRPRKPRESTSQASECIPS